MVAGLVIGAGCSGSSDEKGGGGATCASTCKKSIALQCPQGEHDQAACEASCAKQESSCDSAGASSEFQTYLDCVQSSAMECGSTTNAPSSPECMQQGLVLITCVAGMDAGGGGSGGSGSGTGMGMQGDPCSHDTDCLGYRRCKNGSCNGVMTCTNDGSCGSQGRCYADAEAGNICWPSCTTDAECVASGYVDWQTCTNGWCAKQ